MTAREGLEATLVDLLLITHRLDEFLERSGEQQLTLRLYELLFCEYNEVVGSRLVHDVDAALLLVHDGSGVRHAVQWHL